MWRVVLSCIAIFLCALPCLCMVGCGEFRGIPSHGGGKRFDEEQRVVVGAIRQTLADMDLHELEGKKVQLAIESVSTDGGGNVVFPGINGINAGINGNIGTGNLVQVVPAQNGGGSYLKNDNTNSNVGGSTGINYNPQTQYSATAMSSLPDLGYFRAALEMKSRHAGVTVVPADPDVLLFVLIDVLGTNRSHSDQLFASREELEASCECTYYAQEAKTGRLVFAARRASSEATYNEFRVLGASNVHISRTLYRSKPTRLPIDEPDKPTTRPVVPIEVYVDTKDKNDE